MLVQCLTELERDDLGHLHWAVANARPLRAASKRRKSSRARLDTTKYLPRRYAEISLELVHEARESLLAAQRLLSAPAEPCSAAHLSSILNDCFTHFASVVQSLNEHFADDRLEEIDSFAEEKQAGWPAWAIGIREAIQPCRRNLFGVFHNLYQCSRELTERSVGSSVIVNNHNHCTA